jgi:tetrapyrrole methylase family protein/MazG family protein
MKEKHGVTLLGLGPGDPQLLTREAWETLEAVSEVYLRTRQHPTVAGLPSHLQVHSFDDLYEQLEDYEQVYAAIVERVLELGRRPEGVLYAVPGHPFVAESTSPEIARRAREQGLAVRVVEGLSFIEPTLTALGADLLPRSSVMDALELAVLHHPLFPPDAPALIAQLHSAELAAEVKITLMAVYPNEHPVRLVHAAGTPDAEVEELPLYQIDRSIKIGPLTSLYLLALGPQTSFEAFQELIAHLRAPEGCPWDRQQTHQSLRPNLLEEAYEVLNALDEGDADTMREEFGDLLLQVVLHAQIAAEDGEFTMAEVLHGIHAKLVHRHPHVFGDLKLDDARAVKQTWEHIKAEERQNSGKQGGGLLNGVPLSFPALAQADAYQKRTARVGFDWPDISGVLVKVAEELKELDDEQKGEAQAAEFGDLLFALVNWARWKDIDAESALRQANQRFRGRFAHIEAAAVQQGRALDELSLEEMDQLWEQAKRGD